MKNFIISFISLISLAFIWHSVEGKKIVFCYYGTWAHYREGNGKMSVDNIDPNLCTHLGYTFFGLNSDGSIKISDPWLDLGPNEGGGLDNMRKFNALKKKNRNLKTFVVVGGWNEGSERFSDVAKDSAKRKKFISTSLSLMKKYGFDGLDIDWEYPSQREGSDPSDKKNFNTLLKEVKAKLSKEKKLLSAAVAAGQSSASQSYDIPTISKYLDFINVMTYDFHGQWDTKTGVHAPLHPAPNEDPTMNVKKSIEYWIKKGAPPEKLILGIPFYARTFTLKSSSQNGVGSPVTGPGKAGKYTEEAGLLGYNELCEQIRNDGWSLKTTAQKAPYAFKGNQWAGFDNAQSIKEKARFVLQKNLGGMMMWSIDTDDFRGTCGTKWPLLKAMNNGLKETEK